MFAPRRLRSGDKVERDAATRNQGKVRLGEAPPRCSRRAGIRSGDKVERDAATRNQGKVRLGERRPGVRAARIRSGREGRA